jgi:Domain of unknown function (DUF1877)
MAQSCTMFSVSDAEIQPASDMTLPTYDEITSKVTRQAKPHTLELGPAWGALHTALGSHGADSALGFLAAGGVRFAPLEDGDNSSGRYFNASAVIKLLAAIAKVDDRELHTDVRRPLQRVRMFLGETVEAERGIIVHLFG